jgi:DNA-binding CsgD family transcriptional regulator/DNA-binding phage protein
MAVPSPYPLLNDPDWLRTEYLERGRTAADIAAEVGCPHRTVDRALRRHDIRRPPHRTLADVPADWLREQYVGCQRSLGDIAAEVGLSRTSVRRALVDASIPIDDGRLPAELNDPDWLATQEGVTNAELARRLGCTKEAVSRARQRHGLRQGVRRETKYPQLGDRDWPEDRYIGRGMTQAQIALEIGCARSAVAQAMHRLGLQARPNRVPEYPELHDREWLAARLAAGGTASSIARELGCHHTSAAAALRTHGLG